MATSELKKSIRTAIVEDDPALRKMIVSLLQADPHYGVVAEFAEGKAAIAAIPRLGLDIALVDIGLPDISGIEVIRERGTAPQSYPLGRPRRPQFDSDCCPASRRRIDDDRTAGRDACGPLAHISTGHVRRRYQRD